MQRSDEDGDGFDLELVTASLLADTGDLRTLMPALVRQLSGAFGGRLRVERRGGLLRKSDEIKSVEVTIGTDTFRAEVDGNEVTCLVAHASGGIRIRRDSVILEEWLRRLLGRLHAEAAHNQAARQALETILSGGSL